MNFTIVAEQQSENGRILHVRKPTEKAGEFDEFEIEVTKDEIAAATTVTARRALMKTKIQAALAPAALTPIFKDVTVSF